MLEMRAFVVAMVVMVVAVVEVMMIVAVVLETRGVLATLPKAPNSAISIVIARRIATFTGISTDAIFRHFPPEAGKLNFII